jgi:Domain of unknown function (DUF4476)
LQSKILIMAKFLLCCLIFSVPFITKAQQNRFIYVQTENKQAFYIKIDKKVYSSALSGYVIIPQLKDGDYNLSVGFPRKEWPEQVISCKVDKKDAGYILKNFGEKGWGLFNIQTLQVLMPGASGSTVATTENKKDEFSNMLANAVNDSSIRKVEIVKTVEKKENPAAIQEEPPVPVAPRAQTISKLLYLDGKEGYQMVFSDVSNGKADTIRLLIPAEKAGKAPVVPEKETVIPAPAKEIVPKEPAPKEVEKEPAPAPKEKFIEMELPNPNTKQDTPTVKSKEPAAELIAEKPKPAETAPVEAKKVTMINSNCKNYAVEEDFLKLRKKMAAEDNDDDMVATAKKTFKTKCFNTEQLKNLSVLFLKDEGRYKFFDAAYPFVSDSENFGTLRTQLTDEYYISRFNAMIKH